MKKSRGWDIALWVLSLILLGLMAAALRDRWVTARDVGGWPSPAIVVLAIVLNSLGNAVAAVTWRELVTLGRGTLSIGVTFWIWASSQLARYGVSGAQVLGRAVMARRHGVDGTAGGVTAVVEVFWLMAVQAVIVLLTLPFWVTGGGDVAWLAAFSIIPAAVLVVAVVAPRRLLRVIATFTAQRWVTTLTRGKLTGDLSGVPLTQSSSLRVTGLFILNLAIRLSAFALITLGVSSGATLSQHLPRVIAAYLLGQIAGRLAIFAPGGIGPREGVAALVLGPALGVDGALIVVTVVRLTEILAEVVFLGVSRVAYRFAVRHT